MLFRKIESLITQHLQVGSSKILLIDGARKVGKTYIIRHVAQKLFPNYVELNLLEDSIGDQLFATINTLDDFYLRLSMVAGDRMKGKEDTLVFLDEIQVYPYLLSYLKFLAQDRRFTFITSSSLLDVVLAKVTFIPMDSIRRVQMYPLDFEEFLHASGMNSYDIDAIRERFLRKESLDEPTHNLVLDQLRKYLLVGGMPDAVNAYLAEKNIFRVREVQRKIHDNCEIAAAMYGAAQKLKIRQIYSLIPSVDCKMKLDTWAKECP